MNRENKSLFICYHINFVMRLEVEVGVKRFSQLSSKSFRIIYWDLSILAHYIHSNFLLSSRCTGYEKDKGSPKYFSAANKMDQGEVHVKLWYPTQAENMVILMLLYFECVLSQLRAVRLRRSCRENHTGHHLPLPAFPSWAAMCSYLRYAERGKILASTNTYS